MSVYLILGSDLGGEVIRLRKSHTREAIQPSAGELGRDVYHPRVCVEYGFVPAGGFPSHEAGSLPGVWGALGGAAGGDYGGG